MGLYDDASLIFLPTGGAGKDTKAYSVKPTDGSGDFTFSRGTNATATRVNSQGIIEKGRVNWINYSNDFSQWYLNLMPNGIDPAYTATSGQEGYDGTNNAWKLELNYGGVISMSTSHLSPDEIHTFSFYAKKGTLDYIYVEIRNVAESFFNIGNGTLGDYYNFSQPDVLDRSIQDVGNGWYRCVMTFDNSILASNSIKFSFTEDPVQWGASVGDYTFLQHVQLESGLVETDYIEAGATEGSAGLLEDEPRFDFHDPNSSAPSSCGSLLLERQQTNHIWFSEWFGGWDNFSVSLTHKDGTSPSGYNDATRLYIPADDANVYIRAQFYNIANETHIGSVFLKKIDGDEVRLRLSGNTPSIEGSAIFNLSNGTYRDAVGSVTPKIENYGNGWYRCSVGDLGGATVATPSFRIDALGTGYAPTVYVWGAQVETGTDLTSYIPNHYNWIVTRSKDVTDSLATSAIEGATEFTWFFDINGANLGEDNFLIFQLAGSSSTVSYYPNNGGRLFSVDGGWFSDSNTYGKVCVRLSNNVLTAFYNGVKSNVTASTSFGTTTQLIGLNHSGGMSGPLRKMLFFKTALSDADCISLTL